MPYDKEILGKILLNDDCRTIDCNGTLYPPSNIVYSVIAENMKLRNSHISARHVYTILNENRNGFKEIVRKHYGWTVPAITLTSCDSTIDQTCSSNTSVAIETNGSKSIRLILSSKNWRKMSPKKKVSSGRVYWKFQEGWTDILAERLYQQQSGLDCVFAFKNNIVTPSHSARYYAIFSGVCVECQAKLTGTLLNAPVRDVDVVFSCQIKNINTTKHSGNKKRQLRGKRRVKTCQKMIEGKIDAVTFRRDEARRLKKFGGTNVPIIPNAAVLRKAKEKHLLKTHGLEYANAPLNLLHEARSGKFAGSIHNISLLKFNCIYWTPEQQQLYIARSKRDDNAILTIDASGGFEKRSHKEDPHVFLYQCMVVTTEGSVPVFQMVSADQRSLVIAHFLRQILSKGAPSPPIVVCDFGRALVNAVAEIFGRCSDLQDYLQRCYDIVHKKPSTLPGTYIRLDVSHLISMVSRWKCLKGKMISARRLYLRCIAQAYQMSDLDALSSFIEAILAVALSESIGSTRNGENVPAQACMEVLNNAIEGTAFVETQVNEYLDTDSDGIRTPVDYSDNNRNIDENYETGNSGTATDWKSWSSKLYASAECISRDSKSGKVINGCYNPQFAQYLRKQLLPYLPLWTGVMRPHFGRGSTIATSSAVEGEFNNLKNRVFRGKLPMRIDRFVVEHLHYLDGRVTEASNKYDLLPNATQYNQKDDDSIEIDFHDIRDDVSTTPRRDINATTDFTNSCYFRSEKLTMGTSTVVPKMMSNNKNVTECANIFVQHAEDKLSASLIEIAGEIAETLATVPSAIEVPLDASRDCDLWNECENWRGLGNDRHPKMLPERKVSLDKKRRKPTYLDKCPEWQFIKDTRISKLPIFINGNFCGPVNLGKTKLNIKKTCAFDSIIQLVMSGIATNHDYERNIKNCPNATIQLALKVIGSNKNPTSKSYLERANILSVVGLFSNQKNGRRSTGHIEKLDAECNAAHLAEYLFTDVPSYTRSVSCQCGRKFVSDGVMLNVNVDILLCDGFNSMQLAVDEGLTRISTCRRCKRVNKECVTYGPHILIDMSVLTDERYTTRNPNLRHDLDSIATTISLQGKIYVLAGIINWTPGHYVAFVKCGLYWYEYNDIGPLRKSVTPKTQVAPHVILYTLKGSV